MIHSTSLRAAGSEMEDSISVALPAPPLCRLSMALLTSAMSASELSGAAAGAADDGTSAPALASSDEKSVAAGSDESGGAGGRRAAVAASLRDFSLALAAAFFFSLCLDAFASADGKRQPCPPL